MSLQEKSTTVVQGRLPPITKTETNRLPLNTPEDMTRLPHMPLEDLASHFEVKTPQEVIHLPDLLRDTETVNTLK